MGIRSCAVEALVMKSDLWRGKRVFLTGHTGFKGAWLSLLLRHLGALVKGYALAPATNSLYREINGDSYVESTIADIRDLRRLELAISSFAPDFIFHLAAQPLVLASYNNPVETYETNVLGTAHVLECLRKLEKPCHVVVITTDKVYENREWFYPYRETDRLGGFDPYSSSKACAELIVASMRNSFFPPTDFSIHGKSIAVARAGNVIGGGDWAENRILPDVVRALSSGSTISIRNPTSVRPWQHVLEALVGYLELAERLAEGKEPEKWGDAWNFGPTDNELVTVENLVAKCISIWGSGAYECERGKPQPHEAAQLRLDCSKAVNVLGWHPKMDTHASIAATMEWYKAVLKDGQSPLQVTNQQIAAYFV